MKNLKINAMTVDVEDYFQVAAFDSLISPDNWGDYSLRVFANTTKILDIFRKHNVKATFFILGWVAEREPELIRLIAEDGHEIANHGYMHQKAFNQTYEEFLNDITKSKKILEEISGKKVVGYRAPSFSIDKRNEWAFDALLESGHLYSSSTYPVSHDHYGTPEWSTKPFKVGGGLLELPQATIDLCGRRLPVGGGGYFRLFPLMLSEYFLGKFHEQHDHPYIFYFHPWEIDPEQPRVEGASSKSKFRHYVNLSRMEAKIAKLCKNHKWESIETAFNIGKE